MEKFLCNRTTAQRMHLEDYKQTLTTKLSQRTVCFLVKENEVLLGLKKRGFGQGKWTGIGGKLEEGETVEQAALREVFEEICVQPKYLKKVARVNFYFPFVDKPEKWNQEVHFFVTSTWDGIIKETEEIKPQWFSIDQIPFHEMWPDAPYWLKDVLNGKILDAEFLYDKELKVIDYKILPKQ